jgi:hypothetical protein
LGSRVLASTLAAALATTLTSTGLTATLLTSSGLPSALLPLRHDRLNLLTLLRRDLQLLLHVGAHK